MNVGPILVIILIATTLLNFLTLGGTRRPSQVIYGALFLIGGIAMLLDRNPFPYEVLWALIFILISLVWFAYAYRDQLKGKFQKLNDRFKE